jgi:hypothetical protein
MEKAPSQPSDYRYERKFCVSGLTDREVESLIRLHPVMFLEVYPPRWINNVYLDSLDRRNYRDNLDGIDHRVKVRIRWYGDLLGPEVRAALELKIKLGLLGTKRHFPLMPFSVDNARRIIRMRDALERSAIPQVLKLELLSLEPALLNRYRRKYFQSADGRFRITIDSQMESYRIRASDHQLLHRSVDRTSTIVELKYDPAHDPDAPRISNRFPFRMTKNSKYVSGIERGAL